MSDTTVTILGNMTRDIELRFTPSGKAVGECSIAVNKRVKVGDGTWEDGDPEFYDVTIWGDLAEHAIDSLSKGNRVMVVGRLQYVTWETPEGDKRSKVKIVADAFGPDLRWATASVTRSEKGGDSKRPAPAKRAPAPRDDEAPF